MGGRQSSSICQYSLKKDNRHALALWAGKLADAMKRQPQLAAFDTKQGENEVEMFVNIGKGTRYRLRAIARRCPMLLAALKIGWPPRAYWRSSKCCAGRHRLRPTR